MPALRAGKFVEEAANRRAGSVPAVEINSANLFARLIAPAGRKSLRDLRLISSASIRR
jgi:hypothetical protein